jgi:hypothetical protein
MTITLALKKTILEILIQGLKGENRNGQIEVKPTSLISDLLEILFKLYIKYSKQIYFEILFFLVYVWLYECMHIQRRTYVKGGNFLFFTHRRRP